VAGELVAEFVAGKGACGYCWLQARALGAVADHDLAARQGMLKNASMFFSIATRPT